MTLAIGVPSGAFKCRLPFRWPFPLPAELTKSGASKLVVDVRRVSNGTVDDGLALARLFVGKGTLAIRESKGGVKEPIAAAIGQPAVGDLILVRRKAPRGARLLVGAPKVGVQMAVLIQRRDNSVAARGIPVRIPRISRKT